MKHPSKPRSVIFALLAAGGAACWGAKQRGDERAGPPTRQTRASPPDAAEEPLSTEPDPLTEIAPPGPEVAQAAPGPGSAPPPPGPIPAQPGPTGSISPPGGTR